MIAFGCAVVCEREYAEYALPGITRVTEDDSLVLVRRHQPLQTAYNSILDELCVRSDVEAVVLVHQDLEIVDVGLLSKLRACLADPLVAVVGAYGAADVRSLAYWEGRLVGRVGAPLLGAGGDIGRENPPRGDVDAVDGLLMALSSWAVRSLRFDERFIPVFHGYDIDFCFQARARGRRILVEALDTVHHAQPDFFARDKWATAEVLWQRKWRPSLTIPGQ